MIHPIDTSVKRFAKPDTYFEQRDRCVPIVPREHANESNLRWFSVPLEEYIAEQLDYRVVGDLIVLGDNEGVEYTPDFGLIIPDEYDAPFRRERDGVPVYSYADYDTWTKGGELPATPSGMSEWRYSNAPQGDDDIPLITVENDGEFVAGTNYFSTKRAQDGLAFLSMNAGALRLLVPASIAYVINEVETGRHVVVTHGVHRQVGLQMYELLFDDGSDSPFSFQILPEQIDRGGIGIAQAASKSRKLHVYLEDSGCRLVATFDVFFRESDYLPCLKPWRTKC